MAIDTVPTSLYGYFKFVNHLKLSIFIVDTAHNVPENTPQMFSMGFKSGMQASHFIMSIFVWDKHAAVAQLVLIAALACRKVNKIRRNLRKNKPNCYLIRPRTRCCSFLQLWSGAEVWPLYRSTQHHDSSSAEISF